MMSDMDETELSVRERLMILHKAEKKEMQAKAVKLKKSTSKDNKKKKKEIAGEIATLEAELNARHSEQLKQLYSADESSVAGAVDGLKICGGSTSIDEPEPDENEEAIIGYTQKKVSKAEKKRQKKAQANKDREEEIKEQAKLNKFSSRNVEIEKMKNILKERKLKMYEIKSDGDCLYAAIAHQLQDGKTVRDLRLLAATFIREHMEDFVPFITNPATGDLMTPDQLDVYCIQIESTSTWGGQPELRALSQELEKKIEVLQVEGGSVLFGDDFPGTAIILTYYRHLYELGEHYNSVTPREEPPPQS